MEDETVAKYEIINCETSWSEIVDANGIEDAMLEFLPECDINLTISETFEYGVYIVKDNKTDIKYEVKAVNRMRF